MASNSNSVFSKVSIDASGLFIPKTHIQNASKSKSGSSNISSDSRILEFDHPVHGCIITTKKRMIILDPPAHFFTPAVPSTPTLSKGPQELLEDEKFVDQQLAHFAVEQRKLELWFQSYRDHKIEFIRKCALEDTMNPNDQIKHAAMIAAADPKVQNEGDEFVEATGCAMLELCNLLRHQA